MNFRNKCILTLILAGLTITANGQTYRLSLEIKSAPLYFSENPDLIDAYQPEKFVTPSLYSGLSPVISWRLHPSFSIDYQYMRYSKGMIISSEYSEWNKYREPTNYSYTYHILGGGYHHHIGNRFEGSASVGVVYRKFDTWRYENRGNFWNCLPDYRKDPTLKEAGLRMGGSIKWKFPESQRFWLGAHGSYHVFPKFDTWSYGITTGVGLFRF